jgi:hypothetical protein
MLWGEAALIGLSYIEGRGEQLKRPMPGRTVSQDQLAYAMTETPPRKGALISPGR